VNAILSRVQPEEKKGNLVLSEGGERWKEVGPKAKVKTAPALKKKVLYMLLEKGPNPFRGEENPEKRGNTGSEGA